MRPSPVSLQERERQRDFQDSIERHIWGQLEYLEKAGAIIRVKGTKTEDLECAVVNSGYGFNVADDTNTEVVVFMGSSDSNLKLAILTLPRDKQRQWKQGTGGVQDPTNPDRAVEFNSKRTHVTQGAFAVGSGGFLEVDESGNVTIRGNITIAGNINVNGDTNFAGASNLSNPVVGPGVSSDIPGFEA